ncbi:DUF1206 domain-containing protein [Amnibacterium sp. CER49]|uniref:DUF1206 domain-containing protein n=1 Tax=Amnibacterium sp. CER49 TaxID=3039161 RepID=UPI00244A2570|nr:DUF1206 domain-containing protein [Amnibacterium sp. CER49]MDH2443756.1 DUF1206 domain-containing protein [Amnibacterium sp. CER49]
MSEETVVAERDEPAAVVAGAARAARKAHRSAPWHIAARVGFAVSGLVQLMIGVIALQVAYGAHEGQADQSGALEDIARAPGGPLLLGICIVGFAALGLWLALSAALRRPTAGGRARSLRLGDGFKALVYLGLAGTALTVLVRGTDDSAASTHDLSAALLRMPGGQALLAVVGFGVIAVAGYLVQKGVRRGFRDDIDLPDDLPERPVIALGVLGYVARGVALGTVGALVVAAALTADPARANGLDAALRSAAELPSGRLVLTLIAAGWLASGVYGFVRAARARMR